MCYVVYDIHHNPLKPASNKVVAQKQIGFEQQRKGGADLSTVFLTVFEVCLFYNAFNHAGSGDLFDGRPTTRIEKATGNRGAVLNKKPRFPVDFCFPPPCRNCREWGPVVGVFLRETERLRCLFQWLMVAFADRQNLDADNLARLVKVQNNAGLHLLRFNDLRFAKPDMQRVSGRVILDFHSFPFIVRSK